MAKNGVSVGIDLEQSSIAGAQIRGAKTGQTLTAAAVRALPEGLVFEGEVVDVDGLAAQLKSFWKEAGFSGRRLRLGVANQKIVVRTMEFPLIDEKELEAAIQFQAQEAIPIPLDEAILDYQVLATVPGEEGAGKQKVLIVAAQRDMIGRFVEVAKKASLGVEAIDLQAFALTRAVSPAVPFVDQGGGTQAGEATALVHIGSGITNLVVAAGGMPQFTRVINLGCESLVQALITNRGIGHDEADALRLRVGVSGGSDEAIADLEPDTVAEVHEALDAASESFADEIRRSIDYYHSQEPEGQISSLLITGEGALTRHMPEYLTEALHLPVSLGNAAQRITENKTRLSQADLDTMAPRLAIAIGLALDDEE